MPTLQLALSLLRAIQKFIYLFFKKGIFNIQYRSIARYEATINAGLDGIASNEVREKLNVEPELLKGRVMFKTDAKLTDILKLRSVNNIFVMVYDETLRDEDMPSNAESVEQLLFKIGNKCDWRNGLEKWIEMSGFPCDIDTLLTKDASLKSKQPKFRISSNRYGSKHKFSSPELCTIFGHVVDTKFGWPIKLRGMDLDIYINFIENRVYVNITLSHTCLAYRNITFTGLTTLKATTCYAMLKRANIQTGDILVDPMAGSGAIPLECCDCYYDGEMLAMVIGGELRKQTLRKCCHNVQIYAESRLRRPPADFIRLNVMQLPFRENSVDVFVSDLPFGHRHGSKQINMRLYPSLLKEMARTACLTSGRAVLLTHDHKSMILAHELNSHFWTKISEDPVKVGNLRCIIYVYQRSEQVFTHTNVE